MTNKIYIGIIVALVAVGGYMLFRTSPALPPIGAVSGPSSDVPYFTFNNVTMEYRSVGVKTATTTLCAIKSPSATSTLLTYTIAYNRTSADGATEFDVTQGTTAFATTTSTVSNRTAVATGPVQGVAIFQGTTTPIVSPNTFIVTKLATSSLSANFAISGVCKATFQTL